jgi:hypothetical protein
MGYTINIVNREGNTMTYKDLAKLLEADYIAAELKRRTLKASEDFLAAVKEFGSAERANANTNYEKDNSKHYAMLEGYALSKTVDWSVAFDAVLLFVYGEE